MSDYHRPARADGATVLTPGAEVIGRPQPKFAVDAIQIRARIPAIAHREARQGEDDMPRVSLEQRAPDFRLPDFTGQVVTLSSFLNRKHVLLVFNRTFA